MSLRLSAGQRGTAGLLVAIVAVWSLAAVAVPLFPDEVYYWEWSRRLAAGYFDHPPAIAWLIRAGTLLVGDTALGVRAMPMLCGVLTALAVGRMAALLGGAGAGFRAVLLLVILPLATGAFVLATPDAPLLATTSWGLYAVLRAVAPDQESRRSLSWWIAAGVLLGLAGLSKYIAILVPIGLAGTVALHRPLRRHLATPGPWVATIVALLTVAPVVLWNASHDWVSFRFQLAHGLSAPTGGGLLDRELELLGGQLLVATPILFAFLAASVWRTARRRTDPCAVLLAGVSLTVAAAFAWSATRQRVEANWLAVAYPPAVVLLAGWSMGPRARRWLRIGTGLSGALTAVLLLHLATPWMPLANEPPAVSQAFGWAAAAEAVGREVDAWEAPGALHLAANRYQEAAAISFLLPGHPTVFALNIASRSNQYDLWAGFAEVACPGDGMLLVLDEDGRGGAVVLRELAPQFAEVVRGELVERRMPGGRGAGALVSRSRLWVLRGWTGAWTTTPAQAPRARVSSPAAAAARCRS